MSTREGQAYILLGGRRLAAISERIREALDAVARDWFKEPNVLQLKAVTALESVPLRASRLRYVARDGEAWVGFVASDFVCAKLAEIWFGCEVATPGPLVESLERELYLALFGKLRGTGTPAVILEPTSSLEFLEGDSARAGAGTAVVEIDIDGAAMALFVPASVWPDLLDVPVGPSGRVLEQAAAALTNNRIRLEARLPPVEMRLAEVTALAPGDFVDLQLDLSGAVRLVGQNIDLGTGLEAVLGKRDGRRVIQLSTRTDTTK